MTPSGAAALLAFLAVCGVLTGWRLVVVATCKRLGHSWRKEARPNPSSPITGWQPTGFALRCRRCRDWVDES